MKEPLIPVAEALARVLASVERPVSEEMVKLNESFGRTLARDVIAARTQPPFANSAMDGYAVRAVDTANAGARLECVGESAAGRPFSGVVGPGQAARIFTGAPIPEGADAVIIQELTLRESDIVITEGPIHPADNVRSIGIDFQEGERLLPKGSRLTPRAVALAAAANLSTLAVRRRPRVAILATGDELVAPGQRIGPAQIVASNNYFIAGLVRASGGEPVDLGIAEDDPASLAGKIEVALDEKADVLVTLGGASVGDYDLVQKALTDAGMQLGFWKIAMRPGKPLMHGRIGGMQVLGLPGNPTSSAVCGVLFLGPLLRALLGQPDPGAEPLRRARLSTALPANGVRQDYLRARLWQGSDGEWVAAPLPNQDSSLVKMLALGDGLIVRAIRAPAASAGDLCQVVPFDTLAV